MLHRHRFAVIGLAVVFGAIAASPPSTADTGVAGKRLILGTRLDGAQVVIPNDPRPPSGTASRAVGKAMLHVTSFHSNALWYTFFMHVDGIKPGQLDPSHGGNRTAVHVHLGNEQRTGPILIDIGHTGRIEATPNGFVMKSQGKLSQRQGDHDTGFDPEQIFRALQAEEAYLAVHTERYPAGEIRGNLKTADRFVFPARIDDLELRSDDELPELQDENWGDIKALYRQ